LVPPRVSSRLIEDADFTFDLPGWIKVNGALRSRQNSLQLVSVGEKGFAVEMTTLPVDAPPTNDVLTWREARYLARVVQMLVSSPNDRDEFRRELAHLLRAAEALRGASARGTGRARRATVRDLNVYALNAGETGDGELETATEGAVIELWRSNSVDYARLQATAAVAQLQRSAPASPDPIDESELACAVDEIERAAAALRAEERRPPPVRVAAPEEIPSMKKQIMEFWLPVVAAIVGMLAAIVSFIR
jgi:hypothetical protein